MIKNLQKEHRDCIFYTDGEFKRFGEPLISPIDEKEERETRNFLAGIKRV